MESLSNILFWQFEINYSVSAGIRKWSRQQKQNCAKKQTQTPPPQNQNSNLNRRLKKKNQPKIKHKNTDFQALTVKTSFSTRLHWCIQIFSCLPLRIFFTLILDKKSDLSLHIRFLRVTLPFQYFLITIYWHYIWDLNYLPPKLFFVGFLCFFLKDDTGVAFKHISINLAKNKNKHAQGAQRCLRHWILLHIHFSLQEPTVVTHHALTQFSDIGFSSLSYFD